MISGLLLEKSIPGELLSLWEANQYDLITSPEQIDELGRVLNYGKLSTRIDAVKAANLMASLHATAWMTSELPEVSYSADTADNLIIATAIAGQADALVSGDKKHLLPLGVVEGVSILTPRQAIEKLQEINGPEKQTDQV